MNANGRRRLTSVLGATAATLALLQVALWSGWGRSVHWDETLSPSTLPSVDVVVPPPAVPPLEAYAAVWQQPLFSPTRSPEPVFGDAAAVSSDLQLTGVILLPGLRMAILHDRTRNADFRVREGEASPEGAALMELHERSALVSASGTQVRLELVPGPLPTAGETVSTRTEPVTATGPNFGATAAGHELERPEPIALPAQPDLGQQSAEARAEVLRARIDAARRQVQHTQGDR